MEKKFLILGGDERNQILKKLLEKEHQFVIYDDFNSIDTPTFQEKIKCIDYIIGPTPFSKDKTNEIKIISVFEHMNPNQLFFAGSIPNNVMLLANRLNITTIDFFKSKELAILNAIPTAEAALSIAIENTKKTLHDAPVLVLGYGNIGKYLSKLLQSFGSHTYVVARNKEDLSYIKSNFHIPIPLEELDDILPSMDIIFNTIPFHIINEKNIQKIPKEALYVELASAPFGLDIAMAKFHALNFIAAPALPGKTAPETAALYIKETIDTIITTMEAKNES